MILCQSCILWAADAIHLSTNFDSDFFFNFKYLIADRDTYYKSVASAWTCPDSVVSRNFVATENQMRMTKFHSNVVLWHSTKKCVVYDVRKP